MPATNYTIQQEREAHEEKPTLMTDLLPSHTKTKLPTALGKHEIQNNVRQK